MLVALAFCGKDADRALDLLKWIEELGGCRGHDCVLVVDADTPWDDCLKAIDLAKKSFRKVDLVSTEQHVEGWVPGSNALFRLAAEVAAVRDDPFLFLEADAAPLVPGWLDKIEHAYGMCGTPFMGPVITHNTPGLPSPYMEGVAVYPPDTLARMAACWKEDVSWTLACAPCVVPRAANSPLFKHCWGEKGNPPTFAEKNVPGTNVFCLAQIPKEAVIWHRAKDGSLIRLLRKAKGISVDPDPVPITTVFAFCGKDHHLMQNSMAWLTEITPKTDRTCVLHFDDTITRDSIQTIAANASRVFARVLISQYPTPRQPYVGWPGACNWAFIHACLYAESEISGPWLWFEPDAVTVRPDWLGKIEMEYAKGEKPFMGTVFKAKTHMNGVGVYPANAMTLVPCIRKMVKQAWDFKCGSEMIPQAHDASHLIQHNDNDVNWGPNVFGLQNVNFILPTAVIYHPVKNGSLIATLRQMRNSR